jgi:hypothetical protein
LAALLLLVLFVCSITPKRYLHHWFADHTDAALHTACHEDGIHAKADGFNCDCNNWVATTPFTEAVTHFNLTPPHLYAVQNGLHLPGICFVQQVRTGLRGPPALV